MDFQKFKNAVAKQFDRMVKSGNLFRTSVTKDELWNTYLASFPEGTNLIYKTRTEHDCNCCKQFIRAVGDTVAIIDGKVESIWDGEVKGEPGYQVVSQAMAALVKSKPISDEFLHYEKTAGTSKNFQQTVDGVKTWDHFFITIPIQFVKPEKDIPTLLNASRTKYDVLSRGLIELTVGALDTVLELIAQDSLYKGAENKFAVSEFLKIKHLAVKAQAESLPALLWPLSISLPESVARFKGTSIGKLVSDISEGKELEHAVGAYEVMVAPANYKRSKSLITQKQIDLAKKTLEELGLVPALERRPATLADITINNVLFADNQIRSAMAGGIFDTLKPTTPTSTKTFDKVEEVPIAKFIAEILPRATSLEIFVENQHLNNFVTLVAPVDPTAPLLFKWTNGFSWSYNGDVADSIKERVKKAGGNVTGDLCCRLAWFNYDDLDLHLYEPGGTRIYFGNKMNSSTGGHLDVDMHIGRGTTRTPVENIAYPKRDKMKEGKYTLVVNNYCQRETAEVGFNVEMDYLGTVTQFAYPQALSTGQNVVVAEFNYTRKEGVVFTKSLPSTKASREVWGIPTQSFQKVKTVMMSPNFWDGQVGIGNKHYFFMLEGCKTEGLVRGFYNEFLKTELDPHRKVLEVVGSKMRAAGTEQQLSGLGFSSTQRNAVLCKVAGSFSRVIKIVF